jgi:hypothetical protein
MPNTDACWHQPDALFVMVYDTARAQPALPARCATRPNYTAGVPNVAGAIRRPASRRFDGSVCRRVSDLNDPSTGPFSLTSTGPERGLRGAINCPYQASTLIHRTTPGMHPVLANERGARSTQRRAR